MYAMFSYCFDISKAKRRQNINNSNETILKKADRWVRRTIKNLEKRIFHNVQKTH